MAEKLTVLRFIPFPIHTGQPHTNRPVIDVIVRPYQAIGPAGLTEKSWIALIDPGATGVRLSNRVVSELQLPTVATLPTSRSGVISVASEVQALVLLRDGFDWHGQFPVDPYDPQSGFDVILGMDILRNFTLDLDGPRLRGKLRRKVPRK